MADLTASRLLAPVGTAGKLFAFGLDVGRGLFRRPFQFREFVQQAWFIASVTIIPTALVAIPFGAVIALQVGGADQAVRRAVVHRLRLRPGRRPRGRPDRDRRSSSPARAAPRSPPTSARGKIREELDAMMVLGIDPIQRLVVPRVLACMLVAVFLNGLVSVVGVAGGYVFNVVLQGGTPAPTWPASQPWRSCPTSTKAWPRPWCSALIAAIVACYKGMNAGGGPKGVGDAVNESVVVSFMLLFVVNFVMSAIYFQLVPPKTG